MKQVDKLGTKASYSDKKGRSLAPGTHPLPASASGDVQRIDPTFAPGTAVKSGITVLGDGTHSTVIGYDASTGEVYVDRSNSGTTGFHPLFTSVGSAPVALNTDGIVTLRIYVDRSSVEVFAQGGQRTITDQVKPLTVTPLQQSMFK